MVEILARISAGKGVEFVNEKSEPIEPIGSLTPNDAAYLARGILSCAAALSSTNPPRAGTIVGDAHLPITQWRTGTSNANGEPVLILSIPSGIELTFQMPRRGATELGVALLALADGSAPPGGHSGTIH